MVASTAKVGEWVLLTYKLPRTPSTPRIAVWRKLRRLGVAQLADGLVALPADARTREQLEWIAEEVLAAGGTAMLWQAVPLSAAEERRLAAAMARARAEEYDVVAAEATAALGLPTVEQLKVLRRLRSELRAVRRRDFFPPPERDRASSAVDGLAAASVLKGRDRVSGVRR